MAPVVEDDMAGRLRFVETQALEFILAVPGRRYGEFADVLLAFDNKAKRATEEFIEEVRWRDRRLVVAHHPQQAKDIPIGADQAHVTLERASGYCDPGSLSHGVNRVCLFLRLTSPL